jgi:hypothetical protein
LKVSNDRFELGGRRQRPARPVRRKVTIEMDPADESLLRLVARCWAQPLGVVAGVAIAHLVAAGLHERDEAVIDEAGLQRIRDALTRWEAVRDRPVLDRRVHGGPQPGDEPGN